MDELTSAVVGRTWRLTEIDGEPAPAAPKVDITFEPGGRVYGTAGVNRFTGTCRIGDDFVEFDPLATTLMAGLPDAMALESAVMRMLTGRHELTIADDELTIGAARFVPAEPPVAADAVTVSGSVFYRERIAMPAGAAVVVRVLDVSRADAPATTLGETRIEPETQVPVPFTVTVPRAAFTATGSYAVAARIEVDGEPAWVSDTHHPVSPDGPTEVDIMVRRVGGAGG
jgi:uncharacterized lipoprotein YbaY